MDDHASYIGAHERGLQDLLDEGFDLPAKGVVLTYRDLSRDRAVVGLYPTRALAEARAEEAMRQKRARRGEWRIRPLAEAVA